MTKQVRMALPVCKPLQRPEIGFRKRQNLFAGNQSHVWDGETTNLGISEASVASLLEQQDIASFPGQGYCRLLSVANLRQKGMGNEIVAKPEINKEQVVTKQSLSNHQVIVKLSLSIPNIGELLRKMVSPMSAKIMRLFCGQKDSTYFKANVIDPLISEGVVAMTHPDSPKSPTLIPQHYNLTLFISS